MSQSFTNISHGFVILRMIPADPAVSPIPIGVAAWDVDRKWHKVRVMGPKEKVPALKAASRPFIEIAGEQLRSWAATGEVPYLMEEAPPWTPKFWRAARAIMTTAVQLDTPKAMDPMEQPDEQIEQLFETLVRPHVPPSERRSRVDGAITRVLGGRLTSHLKPKTVFKAFHGATDCVLRGLQSEKGGFVIEGVNLAGENARRDADALVSKLLRIMAAQGPHLKVLVAYHASPGGLNGEGHMRDWIQEKVTPEVYCLETEAKKIRDATYRLMDDLGVPAGDLFP